MLALRISFFVFMSIVGVSANVYLYRRLVRDTVRSLWLRRVAMVSFVAPFVIGPISRFGFAGHLAPQWFTLAMLIWWGVTLFTLFALLIFSGVRRVAALTTRKKDPPIAVDEARRLFLSRAVAAGALTAGGATSAFGVYRALTPPEVTTVTVALPGLPKALEGFTIVQLSDVHVGAVIQEKFLDVLVELANAQKPDLLALTGDLVDGTPEMLGPFVARLRNLRTKYGQYFVSGNHDYYSGWDAWSAALPGLGFKVLSNERVVIGDSGGSFDLLGVEDWHSRIGDKPGYDLDAATAGRDPSRASVLMAHQPTNLDAVSAKNIGLQLSGHTHGGQLFPGTIIGDLVWGSRNAGLSKQGNTWQFTSRGCGFVGPPMRVGSPPEVVKLVLVSG